MDPLQSLQKFCFRPCGQACKPPPPPPPPPPHNPSMRAGAACGGGRGQAEAFVRQCVALARARHARARACVRACVRASMETSRPHTFGLGADPRRPTAASPLAAAAAAAAAASSPFRVPVPFSATSLTSTSSGNDSVASAAAAAGAEAPVNEASARLAALRTRSLRCKRLPSRYGWMFPPPIAVCNEESPEDMRSCGPMVDPRFEDALEQVLSKKF